MVHSSQYVLITRALTLPKKKKKRKKKKRKRSTKTISTQGPGERTIDPLALLAAEHVDGIANVCRGTDALQRAHVLEALLDALERHTLVAAGNVVPGILVKHVGLDATGCDGVDRHALFAAVDGERAGEAFNRSLGAGVQRVIWDAADAGRDRRGQDQATPVPAVLEGILRHKELAAAVEVEDLVKQRGRHVHLGAPHLHARVGDDKVQVAKVRDGLVKELGDRLRLANVRLDGDALGAQLGELGDDLLGGLGAAGVIDNDIGAAPAELNGNAPANASPGAGDEGDLASEGAGRVIGGRGG